MIRRTAPRQAWRRGGVARHGYIRGMTRHALAAALLLASAFAGSASAQDATLFGRQIHLQPPRGYCVADEAHVERRIVARVREGLQSQGPLLAMFVDCAELQRARAAGREVEDGFDDYATYCALMSHGELRAIDQVSRQEFLDRMAQPARPGIDQDVIDKAMKQLHDMGSTFTSGRYLGILDLDASAIYMGIAMSAPGQDGTAPARYLGVSGLTLIKGVRISVNRVRRYERPEDLPVLLAGQKQALSALVAANE